jgi:hypothetical protein
MFRVRWARRALDALADMWTNADTGLRQAITAASNQIEWALRPNPQGTGESRPGGRRILFQSPLGAIFRIEADGRTVSVLRAWLLRYTP